MHFLQLRPSCAVLGQTGWIDRGIAARSQLSWDRWYKGWWLIKSYLPSLV